MSRDACVGCGKPATEVEFYPYKTDRCKACWRQYLRDRAAAQRAALKFNKAPRKPRQYGERDATEHEADIIAGAESVVRKTTRAYHAIDILTWGWGRQAA